MALERNLESRLALLAGLRNEIVGPDPQGKELESLPDSLSKEQLWNDHIAVRMKNGEEILTRGSPVRRYGAGILYPRETSEQSNALESDVAGEAGGLGVREAGAEDPLADTENASQKRARSKKFDAEADNAGITATNGFKPSAMGMSFVLDLLKLRETSGALKVSVACRHRKGARTFDDLLCGFYRVHRVKCTDSSDASSGDRDAEWWVRTPFTMGGAAPCIELGAADLESGAGRHEAGGIEGFPGKIALRWHVRSWPGAPEHQRLVTLTLVNEAQIGEAAIDSLCLFQSGIVVNAPAGAIDIYPQAVLPAQESADPLDDERVNRVIYSCRSVRAVGHGCAVDWDDSGAALWTDVMPAWEMSPMDFDVKDADGKCLRLPMRAFAEIDGRDHEAFRLLDSLVSRYENWIEELKPDRFPRLRDTADALVGRCRGAATRMRDGLELLKGRDGTALKAFALANRAMLMAQHRRSGEAREPEFNLGNQAECLGYQSGGQRAQIAPTLVGWKQDYSALDLESDEAKAAEQRSDRPVGQWRPFQLAFLLMSIEGIVHGDSDDREIVDLIWFPTGGGKTEAYLGLTAFTVFFNVLSGRVSGNDGESRAVSILMRYTLRLLTAQQFERAVKLFCAMELIRKQSSRELGGQPFSVGLWVGGSNTPNRIDYDNEDAPGAVQSRKKLAKDSEARNPFALLQCPWCGAKFGHVAQGVVHGYRIVGAGVGARFEYVCPDPECEFGKGNRLGIPAQIVDENLYREPPTLLIGTVDKFAMLAWTPEARSFFGIDNDGKRRAAGPTLIIQDEMHLMTGPLGTMVGLFETAVDALCRYDNGQIPKVIASTATAARAGDQILGLYARKKSMVFPPPGLDAADSFFAREAPDKPGRLYVGVLAPGHGSMQTTQRNVYAALAQGAADLASDVHAGTDGSTDEKSKAAADAADPWWTLLAYYNSLRELGGALTLFGADIPDQLGVLRKRRAIDANRSRRVYVDGRVLELTSRLDSGDVPRALRSLENQLSEFVNDKGGSFSVQARYGPQDACLASNIIEVGVDVPRLSLMAIVGQPKTTAAYIQASSRVGRREDRPGLVVMLYSSTKPRDRSHYERFRAYHQAIYAWVEPTSLTPFSPPVIERALHAVMVSMLRQSASLQATAPQVRDWKDGLDWARREIELRAQAVARPDEEDGVLKRFDELRRRWRAFNPEHWGRIVLKGNLDANPALMYPAGREKPPQWGSAGWATPTSLRAVDATCEAAVTQHYVEHEANIGSTQEEN